MYEKTTTLKEVSKMCCNPFRKKIVYYVRYQFNFCRINENVNVELNIYKIITS